MVFGASVDVINSERDVSLLFAVGSGKTERSLLLGTGGKAR